MWIYQAKGAPTPHGSFETRNIFLGIDKIAKKFHKGEAVEDYAEFAIYINRYLEEIYELKSKIHSLKTPGESESLYTENFILHLMSIARVDVKLLGKKAELNLISSDADALITKPLWLQKNGVGYIIRSYKKSMKLFVKTIGSAILEIKLKGVNVLNPLGDSKNIPFWIDYTSLNIDGVEFLKAPYSAWHNEPYVVRMKVSGNRMIRISLGWKPYDHMSN